VQLFSTQKGNVMPKYNSTKSEKIIMRKIILLTMLIFFILPFPVQAQNKKNQEIQNLKSYIRVLDTKINILESRIETYEFIKYIPLTISIFFGIFCAWWARHTNREALLWFILGLFFNIITGFVLLYKDAKDKQKIFKGENLTGDLPEDKSI